MASPRAASASSVAASTLASHASPRPAWGHALLLEHPDQARALSGDQGLRAGLVHHRGELDRHDEQRPSHPEHPHERPADVERVLELGRLEPVDPRPRREEDRRGIARVEPHERRRGLLDGGRARGEEVAHGRAAPDAPARRRVSPRRGRASEGSEPDVRRSVSGARNASSRSPSSATWARSSRATFAERLDPQGRPVPVELRLPPRRAEPVDQDRAPPDLGPSLQAGRARSCCGRRGRAARCRTRAGSGPGAGVSRSGSGAPGTSNSSRPRSSRKVRSRGRRRSNTLLQPGQPRPRLRVRHRGRAERGQVPQDHLVRFGGAPRSGARAIARRW